MTINVVAFTGRRGSGKSTAAAVLVDNGFVDLKFADPLKNMLRALYRTCGVDDETIERKIEGDLKEEPCEWLAGKTPRYAMQTLGTEWRDLLSKTLWSDIFVRRVQSGKFGNKIVCSDYRFPHETEALEALEAKLIRIERPVVFDDEAAQHISETSIDTVRVHGTIHNEGTVTDLKTLVWSVVQALSTV